MALETAWQSREHMTAIPVCSGLVILDLKEFS